MTAEHNQPILACSLDAIPGAEWPVHRANTQRLFASVQEIRQLPTGYSWRLPNTSEILNLITTFIRYERLCCPFFTFSLEVKPEQGPIWFSITGSIDLKPFLESEGLVGRERC